MITDAPARMARLDDRGRIAPGLRADLVRVRAHEGLPVVRQVWRGGRAGRRDRGAAAPEARLAVYWAPDLDDPLHRDGSAWLGRDAETGAALPQPRRAGPRPPRPSPPIRAATGCTPR